MSPVGENYNRILERIAASAARSGRPARDVRLLGVTKTVEVARIREVLELGLTDIGENRVQEAEAKLPALGDTGVRCHFIGHLQSNKVRRAAELFESIRSVDSEHLARRLDGTLARRYPVFIQVRSGDEASKSGVAAPRLPELIALVRGSKWLRLEGLMAIPPFFEDPEDARPFFRRVFELARTCDVPGISMGMSHDFEVAIEEGATEVRIGTALFGART
jgi:PLP dependent protein